jgi:hypothetical protein
MRKIDLWREGLFVGKQRFHLLSPESAFRLTALVEGNYSGVNGAVNGGKRVQ